MITFTINFDMDGTIADFYNVPGWLDYLEAGDPTPYMEAKPMIRFSALARRLNMLQKQGYQLGIISWLSKSGTDEYNAIVEQVKRHWLAKHLPSVHWDEIHIVPYGTPKETFSHSPLDILFDDEERNRKNWTGEAYDAENIMEVLKNF